MSQLDLTNSKVDKLKHQNRELKKKVHRLEKMNAGWSRKKSGGISDGNSKEIFEMRNKIKIMNERIVFLENNNGALKKNFEMIREERDQLVSVNRKLNFDVRNVNVRNVENVSIERNFGIKMKNLETTVENLEKNNKYLQSENLRIQNMREDKLNVDLSKNEYLESSIKDHNLRISILQSENQKLKNQIETKNLKSSSIFQNRLKNMEYEKDELLTKIKLLQAELTTKKPNIINYQEDESSKRFLELYQKQLEEKKIQIKNLKLEIEKLKDNLQILQSKINQKEVTNNFYKTNQINSNQNHKLDLFKLDFENLDNINKGLQIENSKLKKKIGEMNSVSNTTTVTENIIYKSESGLSKEKTEEVICGFLFRGFEIERIGRDGGDQIGKFRY